MTLKKKVWDFQWFKQVCEASVILLVTYLKSLGSIAKPTHINIVSYTNFMCEVVRSFECNFKPLIFPFEIVTFINIPNPSAIRIKMKWERLSPSRIPWDEVKLCEGDSWSQIDMKVNEVRAIIQFFHCKKHPNAQRALRLYFRLTLWMTFDISSLIIIPFCYI